MTIVPLMPVLLMTAAFGLLTGILFVGRAWIRRPGRRSPLTKDMLRGAGHTLRERIDELGEDFSAYLAMAPLVPLILYASVLQQR